MREIKFRAWDKLANKMVQKNFVITSDGGFYWITYLTGDNARYDYDDIKTQLKVIDDIDIPAVIDFADFNFEHTILMQYTGLKDKNGVEIFEGDIVKLVLQHISIINNNSIEIEISKVEFSPAYFRLGGSILGAGGLISENIEVIGNIYENPELLKGTI